MYVIGWDLGGANLKASDGEQVSLELPFPMWSRSAELTAAIRELASAFQPADLWAVTMTGELADCFETRAEGVNFILQAVQKAAGSTPVMVWTTAGEFVSIPDAMEWPVLAAAANWHGLATWVGRMVPQGASLLVDIGSTSTDIIPMWDGFPDPEGRTDLERLQSGELVYTGYARTPVMAVTRTIELNGVPCPLAAELFATMLDVHLLIGHVEESESLETANGKPATKEAAHDRLARMLCSDRDQIDRDDVTQIALQLADIQLASIASSIERVAARLPQRPDVVLISGSGSFIARQALQQTRLSDSLRIESLHAMLGASHSIVACAFALARLARERIVLVRGQAEE